MTRTKIVCTVGPASQAEETIGRLIQAGMNVARLNFSHGTQEEHGKVIASIRKIATKLGEHVAILQDLAGPKIRIGKINKGQIRLKGGDLFTLTSRQIPGDECTVSVNYPDLARDVKPGDTLLLSDGALELEVVKITGRDIECQVIIGGPLSSFKGINLPSRSIKAPSLTEKDKEDLSFGMHQDVDYVALSFVRGAEDIIDAKRFLEKKGSHIPIIAKIEKHEALTNIDEILAVSDGIMVARGDLGVETPLEKVPLVQKSLIKKANQAVKPVITATQMLRSMVDNPRPTRAEVTDVANAILDGTDAIMLSEETATGKYPVEAVAMMSKIAEDAETGIFSGREKYQLGLIHEKSIPEAVGYAACMLAEGIDASAIISFTQSGSTARLIAKYRPRCPILAPTSLEKTCRSLSLIWGIVPILCESSNDTDDMIDRTLRAALESRFVQREQKVVITAGVPMGIPGTTNFIKAEILK